VDDSTGAIKLKWQLLLRSLRSIRRKAKKTHV
jgi:hypothetical protein